MRVHNPQKINHYGPPDAEQLPQAVGLGNPKEGRPRVMFEFTDKTIAPMSTVIVEGWGKKRYGRGRRRWLETFTDAERKSASAMHTRARRWVLETGHPQHMLFTIRHYQFMRRLADFFASI